MTDWDVTKAILVWRFSDAPQQFNVRGWKIYIGGHA